jgi:hypothetical protein
MKSYILQEISFGRSSLEKGDIGKTKDHITKVIEHLNSYVPNPKEYNEIQVFLKEFLLIRQIALWKDKGIAEYDVLKKSSDQEIKDSNQVLYEDLERLLG